MYTFGQLCVGDLFNTKAARWVKMSSSSAMCVLSGVFEPGRIMPFTHYAPVVLLWSSLLSDDPACSERKSEQSSLSESEKEDRFYRKIEAEIESEQRAQQAAEFKQSLIDERDQLIARRDGLRKYVESGEYRSGESELLAAQDMAMADCIIALGNRIVLF